MSRCELCHYAQCQCVTIEQVAALERRVDNLVDRVEAIVERLEKLEYAPSADS